MNRLLSELVWDALRKRGTATISEILADVGKSISANKAIARGQQELARDHRRRPPLGRPRPVTPDRLAARGKRQLVAEILRKCKNWSVSLGKGRYRYRERNGLKLFAG